MLMSVESVYYVVDYGRVLFESRDENAARVFLVNRGRGLLCKSLCYEGSNVIQEKPRRAG